MNAYYRKVDELCVKRGIMHRALAEKIGISDVTLSRYLTCERSTQLCPFMSICEVFEINPEELYKTYLYARMEQLVAKYRAEHEKAR